MKETKRDKATPWIITMTLIAALAVSYYQWNRYTTQMERYGVTMANYEKPTSHDPTETTNGQLNEAISEFDRENYEGSYALLKKIKPKTDIVYWYLGHIALINGKVYEAKNHSKKIKNPSLKGGITKYVDQIITQ